MEDFRIHKPLFNIMIWGLQGEGKDLLAIKWCLDYFKKGHKVYTNQDVSFQEKKIESFEDLRGASGTIEKHGVLYLHDVDLIFNSRDLMLRRYSQENEGVLEIINNSRKNHLVCFFTTHRIKNVDVKIRSICKYLIIPRLMRGNGWMSDAGIFYEIHTFDGKSSSRIGNLVESDLVEAAASYDTFSHTNRLRSG